MWFLVKCFLEVKIGKIFRYIVVHVTHVNDLGKEIKQTYQAATFVSGNSSLQLYSAVVALILEPQPHHVTASRPTPDDLTPEHWRMVPKNTGTEQQWQCETQSLHMYQDSPLLPVFHGGAACIGIPLMPMATITPSIRPILGFPLPALHLRHQHLSSHTILIHSLHVTKQSQCSQTNK